MGLSLLAILPLVLGIALIAVILRRADIRASASNKIELADAKGRGSHRARLQHPVVDAASCIGCGTCVAACPEAGVLGMIHGQATVIHGARCVGHGLCAEACPVQAIAITLGDIKDRRDLPAVDSAMEAIGVNGLFIAGELGGQALVRTAVAQGAAVAQTIANRVKESDPSRTGKIVAKQAVLVGESDTPEFTQTRELDLLIVGAGPGGLACALQSKQAGINFTCIEREQTIGGTVAAYPRQKLVMTQQMTLPLHGKLKKLSYAKEDLVDLWESLHQQHDLPIETGVSLGSLHRDDSGIFVAETSTGPIHARHVVLALGRRGTPRKLGVPGEELSKVNYALKDAQSFCGRHIVVVGGGDSAIEAALGLAKQSGNVVTLSYRKAGFFRLKARNEKRLSEATAEGALRVLYSSHVTTIEPDRITLRLSDTEETIELPNDDVFVLAGGIPPFALLESAGVSFDPDDHPDVIPPPDRGTGLMLALVNTLLATFALCAIAMVNWNYYVLTSGARAESTMHLWLGPKGSLGLLSGLLGATLFGWNLIYLIRRHRLGQWIPGTLRAWLGVHVLTGLLSLVAVLSHSGFQASDTAGGHAFYALVVVVITGAIGRYFYSFVPRAASGSSMDLDMVRSRLAAISGEWDRQDGTFSSEVRKGVDETLHEQHWNRGFFAKVWHLLGSQRRLRRRLGDLRRLGMAADIPRNEVRRILSLARRAHRLALIAAHYEELGAILSSWRFFHRWLALLLILLTAIHVMTAVKYGEINWQLLPWLGGNE